MIYMHTHKRNPPAPKHTRNIWKAERLVGQISVSKSKLPLRIQKGNNANPSSEMHAGKHASLAFFGFLFFFFTCSAGETGIFDSICVCEALSIKTQLSHLHMTAAGLQQHPVIS